MSLKKNIKRGRIFFIGNILRTPERELTGAWRALRNFVRVVRITAKRFLDDELQLRASALTYSTLLAIVPLLALLIAIAGGFGFENIIESQLFSYFPAQREVLSDAMVFVSNYLKQAQSGVLLGIGIIFLLWTVISLMSNIENTMNRIWQAKERSLYRKINDYTSLFIILPVFMILSGGTSVFMSTFLSDGEKSLPILTPLIYNLLEFTPYLSTIILFTVAYTLIPNTRVKFKYALIAGIVCGIAFQIFQYIYINGQIWVSRYNAIYGSFAFLPLLLLWLQLSWLIFLFGVLLSFSMQNLDYDNEEDMRNISRQYKDFLIVLITSIIVQRFDKRYAPLTKMRISKYYSIPLRLTSQIIHLLLKAGIIIEVVSGDERIPAYQPAFDINKLSVGMLLNRIDNVGSGEKAFRVNRNSRYRRQWDAIVNARKEMYKVSSDLLIKDLEIENLKSKC